MAFYNYYRRRYRSRWPYRSWRRTGVRSAQTSGTRRFSVAIPVEGTIKVPVPSGSSASYSIMFQPYYNSSSVSPVADIWGKYGNVIASSVFQTYTQLYDEVKIDGMQFSMAVMALPPSVAPKGFKVVSAVDRHTNVSDIFAQRSFASLIGAPETISRMFTSLDNARIFRSFYPRDISERTMFMDSSIGTVEIPATQSTGAYTRTGVSDFLTDGGYACFIPGLTVGFELPAAPTVANEYITVQYKIVWRFTFRNPKFGIDPNAKSVKFTEIKSDVVQDLKKDAGVSEGSALRKKEKVDEPVYEESVIPDDEVEMDDESSQPELTKEQLLEMLRKIDEKKN